MMTPNSSLLQWLATFNLDGQAAIELKDDAYYNLADGFVSARILNQISPQYFTDKWLDGIKPVPPNGSWPLRVSNLKRILQKIYDYASDLQSPQFMLNAITPDVAVIAQNFDPDQISRLIQLILFCAINCDKRQDYIDRITNLPTQVKQDIKEAIEELLIDDNNDGAYNQTINTSQLGNDSAISENDNIATTPTTTLNQKFNLSSSSQQSTILSPARSSTYRSVGALRRNSSQTSVDTSKRNDSHLDISSQSNHDSPLGTYEDVKQRLNEALIAKDERAQACYELELKVKQLQLEKDQFAYENEKLLNEKKSAAKQTPLSPLKLLDSRRQSQTDNRIASATIDSRDIESRLKNLEDDSSQSLILHQNKRLQGEVHRLKEELIRIETEREDYKIKSNLLKDDLNRVTSKHDELRSKAEQAKRLQDELDELKQISDKVVSYEAKIENLLKKNNEMKKELKNFEEKNISLIHKIVKLEEENSQLTSTVSQIEIYKKQLQESQVKLGQETHRADKAEVELTRLSEKYISAKNENQKLYETTNQLMRSGASAALPKNSQDQQHPMASDRIRNKSFESVDLDKATTLSTSHSRDGNKNLFGDDFNEQRDDNLNSMSSSVVELKEKLARLGYENELLQNKLNTKRENDQAALADLLESATTKCAKLELENRHTRKRNLLLESRLKDLTSALNGASTSGNIIIDSNSESSIALLNRIEELQRSLFLKEQELTESETKYKKNLQKAKDVIKTLGSRQSITNSLHPSNMSSASSFNSSSLDEVNLLKSQLREREESLIQMERQYSEFKQLKEIHERLIISAFYGLTSSMQWRNIDKRLERTTLTSPPNTASSSMNHSKHSH